MKSYFTKLIPAEGEIKEGDRFFDHTDGLTKEAHIPELYNNPHVPYFDGYKKVKLFLCSRDILPEDYLVAGKVHVYHDGSELPFKEIGEISPEATWVKEGDEFDEEEWRVTTTIFNEYVELEKTTLNDVELDKTRLKIEIKGPCGYYH